MILVVGATGLVGGMITHRLLAQASETRILIYAARAAGVRRLVFVSALGVSEDSPVPFMRAKAMTEGHLRRSGLGWTVLQPDAFMDVWVPTAVGLPTLEGRPVYLVDGGRRRHSLVAAQDVAAYAVGAITVDAARDAVVPIGGPTGGARRRGVREV